MRWLGAVAPEGATAPSPQTRRGPSPGSSGTRKLEPARALAPLRRGMTTSTTSTTTITTTTTTSTTSTTTTTTTAATSTTSTTSNLTTTTTVLACNPANCDDGLRCTDDTCNPSTGVCNNVFDRANCGNPPDCVEALCAAGQDCQLVFDDELCSSPLPNITCL